MPGEDHSLCPYEYGLLPPLRLYVCETNVQDQVHVDTVVCVVPVPDGATRLDLL